MAPIDHLRNRLNFNLNKSRQKFHHSLKEHHKISNIADNIALRSLQFSVILDHKREIDSPIPFGAVNFPFVI
jgi:hypothetical protein